MNNRTTSARVGLYRLVRASEGLHDKLASESGIRVARVRCEKCGREFSVDGANCLQSGWPECCGYTMSLLRPNNKVTYGRAKP